MSFSPSDLATTRVWIEPRLNGPSVGSPVASLGDLSAFSNNLSQATSAKRPVISTAAFNGLPSLLFDGSNVQSLGGAQSSSYDAMTSAESSFTVLMQGTVAALFAGLLSNNRFYEYYAGAAFGDYPLIGGSGPFLTGAPSYDTLNLPWILTLRQTATQEQIRINGQLVAAIARTPSSTSGPWMIGNRFSDEAFPFSGYIGFVAGIATSDISQVAQIEQYARTIAGMPSFLTSATAGRIVGLGDSITYGVGASVLSKNWLSDLRGLIPGGPLVQNLGTPGLSLANFQTPTCPSTVATLWGGTNDVFFARTSAANLYSLTKTLVAAMLTGGAENVVVFTMLIRSAFDSGQEATRVAFNALLRTGAGNGDLGTSLLVDVASDVRLQDPSRFPDGTHPDDLGHSYIASDAFAVFGHLLPAPSANLSGFFFG